MPMTKDEKQQLVEDLKQVFAASRSVILLDFIGLNVADATELRRQIRRVRGGFRVVKNTLALRAAEKTSVEQVGRFFQGPTAVAFSQDNPVELAKVLKEFAGSHPQVRFRAGVLEQNILSEEDFVQLADMPSREELLSRLAFCLNAPVRRLASALQSPLQKLVLVLKQLEEKKSAT